MPDIFHYFTVKTSPDRLFNAVTTPDGLDKWWTKHSSGKPAINELYELNFGAGYEWQARVTKCVPEKELELEMTKALSDWLGTKVGFILDVHQDLTKVQFYHQGWPADNDHYRTSCYCWAMYLRIMKRYLEYGETVDYEQRLEA